MKKVLITGAAGDVGTRLRTILKGVYPSIRISDIKKPADLRADEDFVQADLADMAQVEKAVAGIEGIVHLGGFSVEGSWETIHRANIVGCYNTFEAARKAGVKRIVFATSNHAVGFYPRQRRTGINEPVRPDSRYGVSKAFGEALGAMYAYKHGMSVTCLRIGNVADQPLDVRRLSIWLHPEDLAQLIHIGFTHTDIRHEIFYGMSDNARGFWDNSNAFKFGYRPKHKAEDYREAAFAAQAKLAADPIGDWYVGGGFCSNEFDADSGKLAQF